MSHIVSLRITNHTGTPMTFLADWFRSGSGLANGSQWPQTIPDSGSAEIQCEGYFYCLGWVKYECAGLPVFLCFSNPATGANSLDIGTDSGVYDRMDGKYYSTTRAFSLGGSLWLCASIKASDSGVNHASWDLQVADVSVPLYENTRLADVQAVFAKPLAEPERKYYQSPAACDPTHQFASHFKGISFLRFPDKYGALRSKTIFTHTNILGIGTRGSTPNYLIADQISSAEQQGRVEKVYPTVNVEPDLFHLCSSQACGTFMAWGIQNVDDGDKPSWVKIYDIRNAQVNEPVQLLTTISRNEGTNGVGMTREDTGYYLVAVSQGEALTVYRSNKTDLLDTAAPALQFTVVEGFEKIYFNLSGAGLGLVTEKGTGHVYVFALDSDGPLTHSQVNLYRLDFSEKQCNFLATKQLKVPGLSAAVVYAAAHSVLYGAILAPVILALGVTALNTSLRYGKGLAITSEASVEYWASDRDVWPLWESDKNFGVVIWSTKR